LVAPSKSTSFISYISIGNPFDDIFDTVSQAYSVDISWSLTLNFQHKTFQLIKAQSYFAEAT